MAKPPARSDAGQAPGAKPKGSMALLGMAALFVLIVVYFPATVILVLLGMAPTIVAYVVDRSPQRYSAICVGGMNVAGLMPFVLDLWAGMHTVGEAFDILTNVFSLLIIFGAAGFGWMLFLIIPPVVSTVLVEMAKRRADQCRTIQADLVEEWGQEVATQEDEFGATPPDEGEAAQLPEAANAAHVS